MDNEQGPQQSAPPGPAPNQIGPAPAHEPAGWVVGPEPKRSRGLTLRRIGVGAIVSFLFLAIAYGPSNAFAMLGLAVICTAGVGLIPIAFLSWIVGWVVMAVWQSVTKTRQDASSAP